MLSHKRYSELSGKFHFDIPEKQDVKWAVVLDEATQKTGIFGIKSGEFGQNGEVLKALLLNAAASDLRSVLYAVNVAFAEKAALTVRFFYVRVAQQSLKKRWPLR